MKNTIILLIGLLLVNFSFPGEKEEVRSTLSKSDSIMIFCSPDLLSLAKSWITEYSKLNPDINLRLADDRELTGNDNLSQSGSIGIISNDFSEMYAGSTWNAIIGRDVIVPVYNAKNPFANELSNKGISSENLAQLFKEPGIKNWGSLTGNNNASPVNTYILDDMSVNRWMSGLLYDNIQKSDLNSAVNGEDLIAKVSNDIFSIGIAKLTSIIDPVGSGFAENIKVLPVDRNGNGRIDYMEEIYDDMNALSRGLWIGKYPTELYNNIYTIAAVKPTKKEEIDFIKWILTDGQRFLANYGYSDLLLSERQSKVELLQQSDFNIMSADNDPVKYGSILLILGSLSAIGLLSLILIRLVRRKRVIIPMKETASQLAFNENFVDVPMGLYYDKTHTWAYMEKDGMVRIGIDDFLQHITGPLTRVKMKNAGDKIRKGKPVLSIIQEGKQLNIYAPVSGTIKEHNKLLDTDSSIINSSPYNDGWVYRIEPTNWLKEIQFLIMGNSYKEWLQVEFTRLKEFLSASLNPKSIAYSHVLQDGGTIKYGILKDLGPEIWEDFQTNFIDI